MQNNKGVTLIALVVLIITLIIFASLAVYTGINSFQLIGVQRYKAEMQSIQNAVNEFYSDFKNYENKNEDEFDYISNYIAVNLRSR